MRFWLSLLASLLISAGVSAQPVVQSGSVTPGHAAAWVTSGVQRDAGSATSPNINTLGLYSGSATPFCISSTSIAGTPTGNYGQVCLGMSSTAATLSVTPFGNLGTLPLNIVINGTTYAIGSTGWLSGLMDSQFGSAQGSILYRGASLWTVLTAGSSGQVLQTLGINANPAWASAGGSGTVTNVASGTGLTGGPITSSGTLSLVNPVVVATGGTGVQTLAAHGVLIGAGTSAVVVSTPGISGTVLQSNGASSDPTWNTVAGTGTVTSVGTGTGLTGGTISTSGTISFASIAGGTIWNNATTGSAVPTATITPTLGIPGTSKGTLTLAGNTSGSLTLQPTAAAGTATTATFQASSGTVALLDLADQTVSGGANVTSSNLGTVTTGTTTIDCGTRPLQYFTNGGASTIAAPANDGSCIILSTNNGSAGTLTFSGFSVGSNTGDALTTTNGSKFSIFIWRINSVSGYRVAASQ